MHAHIHTLSLGLTHTHIHMQTLRWDENHGRRLNESCHTRKSVMLHMWMSHVTHMNNSRHTYKWVTSHVLISHVTHVDESRHTHEWFEIRSRFTARCYMCETTRMCNVKQSNMGGDAFIHEKWLIHLCDMSHSNMWRVYTFPDVHLNPIKLWPWKQTCPL